MIIDLANRSMIMIWPLYVIIQFFLKIRTFYTSFLLDEYRFQTIEYKEIIFENIDD